MGIGARLREAREEKNISLESLQETTKIQKRYLSAIEEENFNVLPGKFYARAFIKEYALAVDLDVNELFEEFKDDLPQPEDQSNTQYTRIQQTRKESNLSKNSAVFSIIPTIIVVLLIIGVIFAVWFFMFESPSPEEEVNQTENHSDNTIIRGNENEDDLAEDTEESTEEKKEEENSTEDEPIEDDKDDEIELTQTEENADSKTNSTFDLENSGEDLKLSLNATGDTWLEVENADGEQLFYGTLTPDDSPLDLDVESEKELYLSIGNASVLDIKFNDLDFKYPVDPNENVVQKVWFNIK